MSEKSSEFKTPIISPVAIFIPLFIASYIPQSGSLRQRNFPLNFNWYSLITSNVPSVEMPSIIIDSNLRMTD